MTKNNHKRVGQKSVTWAKGSVVTKTYFRPKITPHEKPNLFYNALEMERLGDDVILEDLRKHFCSAFLLSIL